MVLSDVEETITAVEINQDQEVIRVSVRFDSCVNDVDRLNRFFYLFRLSRESLRCFLFVATVLFWYVLF
jgi:hypothetical protein